MLKVSKTFESHWLQIGNVLKMSIPLVHIDKPNILQVDHVCWRPDIRMLMCYGQIVGPDKRFYAYDDIMLKKYEEMR